MSNFDEFKTIFESNCESFFKVANEHIDITRSTIEATFPTINAKKWFKDWYNNIKNSQVIKRWINADHCHIVSRWVNSEKSISDICITAPTQVGKTEFVVKCINEVLESFHDVVVVVFSANRKDQHNKMQNAIVSDKDISCSISKGSVYYSNIESHKNSKTSNKVVLAGLFNNTQISKVRNIIYELKPKCVVMILDEADASIKDSDVDNVDPCQKKSHNAFVELCNDTGKSGMKLKRAFVTATPEVIYSLFNVSTRDVIQLNVPSEYKHITKLTAIEDLPNKLSSRSIKTLNTSRLTFEYTKIGYLQCIIEWLETSVKGSAFLYCTDFTKINQTMVRDELYKDSCVLGIENQYHICEYNGDGITGMVDGVFYDKFISKFIKFRLSIQTAKCEYADNCKYHLPTPRDTLALSYKSEPELTESFDINAKGDSGTISIKGISIADYF